MWHILENGVQAVYLILGKRLREQLYEDAREVIAVKDPFAFTEINPVLNLLLIHAVILQWLWDTASAGA
jgi:hypothetical protein